ncbi:hypothetical protein TNCV_2807051 [Trichonephila clavipes]|nr:hypothetical protein TNCV_2807051 [Trichonephila clavipes]
MGFVVVGPNSSIVKIVSIMIWEMLETRSVNILEIRSKRIVILRYKSTLSWSMGTFCSGLGACVFIKRGATLSHFVGEEQLSGGSVVVVHEEPHPQMTGTLSYRPEETGGRQWEKSLDTRHRRLDDRYRVLPLHDALFARCVLLTPAHRRRRSLWCREHRNWRDNEWGRVLFTDESRFSLSSDSHRILIWRERVKPQ